MDHKHFIHKKSLGQHFLKNDAVPTWMCEAASLQPGEIVVEIGPGTGMLTKTLLEHGAQVIAVETDLRAITVLNENFQTALASGQLTVLQSDVRTLDLYSLGIKARDYKTISNIPYYLSGLLFRMFLSHEIQPKTLVFLVQKEIARRICANPNRGQKHSLLSLSVQVYGVPHYVRTVPASHFSPPPKVDSAILAIDNISKAHLSNISENDFFSLIHLGLGKKRRQLIGNLSEQYERTYVLNLFEELGIAPDVRGEDLTLPEWLNICGRLQ